MNRIRMDMNNSSIFRNPENPYLLIILIQIENFPYEPS
jgi:hypothetical protein